MRRSWFFLTNHTLVLLCKAQEPESSAREIALAVGLSERRVYAVFHDLEREGYLKRGNNGRRTMYEADPTRHMRHPLVQHVRVEDLLAILMNNGRRRARANSAGGGGRSVFPASGPGSSRM